MSDESLDLFISAAEINDHHGVGILLRRYFPDSSRAISLRSHSHYRGEESFGVLHWELHSRFMDLEETERRLRELLAGRTIRRILAVPYYREDFIHATLAKKITGAPLCVFVMDDQNIFTHEAPDNKVAGLLGVADLRLGISPELCEAYRLKFGHRLHTMPPVLTPGPEAVPNHWIPGRDEPFTCAMIGNIWKKAQFERLRSAVRGAGIRVHWFGNGPQASWLEADPEALEKDGILVMGYLEERSLATLLSSYPLVLVPSGTLDSEDDNPSFSLLSLPSRVLFIATRAHVPILVVGHGETAAGRFVRRLRIGNCCGYTPEALWEGIRLLTDGKRHPKLCAKLRRSAPFLVHSNPGAWIWDSLAAGKPLHAPWQKAFAPRRTWYGRSLEVPAPLKVQPWSPTPAPSAPEAWDQVGEADLPGFAFTRAHHPSLAYGKSAPDLASGLELGSLLSRLTEGLALRLGKPEGRWLVFGQANDSFLGSVPAGTEVWQIPNLDAWQAAQCRSDESWFSPPRGCAAQARRPERFDVLISSQIGSYIHEPDILKFPMWNAFLSRHSEVGAFHAHAFTGLINPHYFWRHALYTSMTSAFPRASHCTLDDLLSASDLWSMSEDAYDRFWKQSIKKAYNDFGRPLGLILAWRST